ncbi:hypothetical protein FACS1894103_6890 [Campylobacterota bacterium]|nr:hypothetical protein FACS1894103_6890 [Campylobacterota bacterium]
MKTPELLATNEDKQRAREILAHISFADAKFRADRSHNIVQDEDTTDEMKEAMRAIDRHYAAAYGIKLG